jgi:hypothetical protein
MKAIITLVSLLVISNSFAGEVVCGSTKASHKRTYPINATAIELAANLGVKTCTGTSSKKFVTAMRSLKHTGKFVVVSRADLRKAKGMLASKGGKGGPSFN